MRPSTRWTRPGEKRTSMIGCDIVLNCQCYRKVIIPVITRRKNAGGSINLHSALIEMMNRGKNVPGGACGFWGACGAGISAGMFVSIISGSTPLAVEPFSLSHRMTSKALGKIGEIGGPRCCKRDSFLSILSAIEFVKEHFGVEMEKPEVICRYSLQNNQCIGKRCPFAGINH